MNRIDYDKHVKLKAGDQIHLIIYHDHADTQESIEEIRKNPLLLYCIGKIVNMHTDDEFYAVINMGSVGRYMKPNWKGVIQKSCIKSMKVIYTIPEDYDK